MNEIMTATAAACFIAVGLGVREEYRRPIDAVAKRASRTVPAGDARHEAAAAGEEEPGGEALSGGALSGLTHDTVAFS